MGEGISIYTAAGGNMRFLRRYNSINLNTSLTLLFGLFGFTLISLSLIFHFILSPMANRAADDFGGLMHIISQSWVSLPENKKVAFQKHLREQHQLFITDEDVPVTEVLTTYPFIPRLEKALHHHTGQAISIMQGVDKDYCFWVFIPQAGKQVRIGFLHQRLGPHPSRAMIGILIAGCFLIFMTTILLVRRITHPITTLSKAVSLVGSGQLTTKIPETGSKELVILACNFNKMTQKITQLISSRNILFGGISHDLRTPITRMYIALELLENEENEPLVVGMRSDLNEMESLIKQALELVRGMSKQQAVDVDINELVGALVVSYQRQNYRVIWKNNNCGSCKLEVTALRRVLCNLLGNAFRYSDQQPVELSCTKEKNKLVIRVLDQGPGIPEDKLEMVFQPFYRLDPSRNKQTGGSGLGLAIVQQLCDIHQWKIKLLIRKQGGLEARLEIPL